MAGDEELERLLREVDASLAGKPSGAVEKSTGSQGKQVAKQDAQRGRLGTAARGALAAGAVVGVVLWAVAFFFSWLPGDQNPLSTGLGAFAGGFLTTFWFGLRRKS